MKLIDSLTGFECKHDLDWLFRLFVISMFMAGGVVKADFPTNMFVKDNTGKSVQYAVVLVPELRLKKADEGPLTAIVDQVNEQFTPYVKVIAPNTQVVFPNSDDTRHHVYSFSKAKTFELQLYRANDAPPVLFDKQGVVNLGCNIHDHMRGHILVTDIAVYAVSDENGLITLPEFDGKSPEKIFVWHPKLAERLPYLVDELMQQGIGTPVLTLPIAIKSPVEKPQLSLKDRLKQFKSQP